MKASQYVTESYENSCEPLCAAAEAVAEEANYNADERALFPAISLAANLAISSMSPENNLCQPLVAASSGGTSWPSNYRLNTLCSSNARESNAEAADGNEDLSIQRRHGHLLEAGVSIPSAGFSAGEKLRKLAMLWREAEVSH